MAKVISFGFSVAEITKAIKEVENFKAEINYKTKILAERLAEEGVYIARVNIAEEGAIYSGELISSLDTEYQGSTKDGATWVTYTDCAWAPFVEFGFGIIGSENPHPMTSLISWKYDVNEHGEKGWFYEKDGQWFWSQGQPSKPFMWETSIELRKRVNAIAREVFAK